MVNLPNIPAMYLSIADKAKESAKEIYQNNLEPHIVFIETNTGNYFEFKIENYEKYIYDVFENLFVSITFMYTAVESITNNLIPNNHLEPRIISKKEHKVGKKWIEKNDPLSYKIKVLIPKIYNFNFDSNKLKFWSEFKELEFFRNELIHLKSDEISEGKQKLGPFLSLMFYKIAKFNIIESGRELIQYLIKNTNNVSDVPFEFHEEPIDIEQHLKHFSKKN